MWCVVVRWNDVLYSIKTHCVHTLTFMQYFYNVLVISGNLKVCV